MFQYKIINKPDLLILDVAIIDFIFSEINSNIPIVQNGILNIVFEDDEIIRKLNREYRNIDNTTDVLSFHYYDNFEKLKKTDIAGEILMSYEKILTQSNEYNNTKESEFYKLLIHSILHILGFDHENDEDYQIMKIEEDRISKSLGQNFVF